MGFSPMGGADVMFSIVPVIIGIGFIVVIGFVIAAAAKGGMQWSHNNRSPVLTVGARVVAKRMSVNQSMHMHGDNMAMNHSSASTTYYATFEVSSGDRMELHVPAQEYGLIAEGDVGELTFQGTRYKGFIRTLR